MPNAQSIVDALRRELRARELTYADVGKHLGISSAHVKRLFGERDFTLERIDQICELLGLEFSDLVRTANEQDRYIASLTREQEAEIVRDPKLLVAAVCALGHWTFEQILETYEYTHAELVGALARLDRLKLIRLHANNRIQPLFSRAFAWIPDGPIQRYFNAEVARDYLEHGFDAPGEQLLLVNGMLSARSRTVLQTRLRQLANELRDLHNEDTALPWHRRTATSMLLAIRAWEPKFFGALRRKTAATSR